MQRFLGHLAYENAGAGFEIGADGFLPHVALVAGRLLWRDVLLLEILVGPPLDTAAIELHSFGEELVAIARELVDHD